MKTSLFSFRTLKASLILILLGLTPALNPLSSASAIYVFGGAGLGSCLPGGGYGYNPGNGYGYYNPGYHYDYHAYYPSFYAPPVYPYNNYYPNYNNYYPNYNSWAAPRVY